MPVSGTKPRKRLTREESRAQTRATSIAVGRRHFLRYGLGGAVAGKIAEDAGYFRGALYSNISCFRQLKRYSPLGLRLGVMSGDRWNSAKSIAPLPKACFKIT
jgi:hypothetical protein